MWGNKHGAAFIIISLVYCSVIYNYDAKIFWQIFISLITNTECKYLTFCTWMSNTVWKSTKKSWKCAENIINWSQCYSQTNTSNGCVLICNLILDFDILFFILDLDCVFLFASVKLWSLINVPDSRSYKNKYNKDSLQNLLSLLWFHDADFIHQCDNSVQPVTVYSGFGFDAYFHLGVV